MVSNKSSPNGAVKSTHFIKPRVHIHLIFYVTKRKMCRGKEFLQLIGLHAQLVAFFMESKFYLKGKTNKVWLFRLGHRGDIFLKTNEVILSLQQNT